MDEQKPSIVETVATVLLVAAEIYVLIDQNAKRNGGEGLAPHLTKSQDKVKVLRDRIVKPWHYPERWRRMVDEVVVEAWIHTEGDS
jgi:hypothetical protein